jgi:hypothetical protein
MEFFFNRLQQYIHVRPSAQMTDIIVKIMVEVISILGIVTKEIRQGRTSMWIPVDLLLKIDIRAEKYLKRLIGRKDVEEALQRLDKLTQEEARMAATESLTITRGIDDKVQIVDSKVQGVDHKVSSVLECELHPHYPAPNWSSAFYSVRCQRDRRSNPASSQSSQRYEPSVIF